MGWIIGYAVAAVIVLLVVALLVTMIAGARRAADQAEAVVAALHTARDRSEGLWAVGTASATTSRITRAAADARESLERGSGATS